MHTFSFVFDRSSIDSPDTGTEVNADTFVESEKLRQERQIGLLVEIRRSSGRLYTRLRLVSSGSFNRLSRDLRN